MRKIAIGMLVATGVAASAMISPAGAQGFWVGAGPVGVGVGVGPGWGYNDGYYDPGYRSYAYDNDDYAYVTRRHCRIVREDFNGHIRRIRHCW